MSALLSVILSARNNFLLVVVIVFVHAQCIVRSASLPDLFYFIYSIFQFFLFLKIYVAVLHRETITFSYFLIETSTDSN